MLRKPYVLFAAFVVLLFSVLGLYAQAGVLDFGLAPRYGGVDLSANDHFPYELADVEVIGEVDASQIASCVGFTTEEPTFRVVWTQGNNNSLSFYFTSDEDTTLIINTAEGDWLCNDDSDGFNPRVEIANAPEGQYDIWVGRYNRDSRPLGTLGISGGEGGVVSELCPDLIPLSNFDPEVVDDNTVLLEYRNQEEQVFRITITGEGVGGERLQAILDETRLCLRATGPLVMPDAVAVDQSPEGNIEEEDEAALVAFEIEVVDIGELISLDYEVHFAVDPLTPQTYTLASATSATVSSLCCTRDTSVTARLYNPRRDSAHPSANLVYTLSDSNGGTCAAMRRTNGTTLYVTAKQIYVSGGAGAYFTMTGTWGTKT